MENNTKLIESLLERGAEYGKTSYTLLKLKAIDKTANVVSSFIPHTIVFALIASFIFFFNLGLSFWLGDLLGKTFYGFFLVAALNGIIAIAIHFFLRKRIKKLLYNKIINLLLK